MKIAITGSSGFIGTHLVRELQLFNYDLILIDNKNGTDITNCLQINLLPKFDIIFHLAAKSYVPESYNNPYDFYYSNIIGTLNILELCRKYKAKIIYISSYVYGNPDYIPINEEHPVKAFNPYSQSKIICEELCKSYNRDFEIPTIIFRPFNIYGLGQNENFLIPYIIKQAINGFINLDDPNPKRDMIYVGDLIKALICAINYCYTTYDVFNIGSGISYSVYEIAQYIKELFNPSAEIYFSGLVRKNEVQNTVADISKAKLLLKWVPVTSFNEGLRKISLQ